MKSLKKKWKKKRITCGNEPFKWAKLKYSLSKNHRMQKIFSKRIMQNIANIIYISWILLSSRSKQKILLISIGESPEVLKYYFLWNYFPKRARISVNEEENKRKSRQEGKHIMSGYTSSSHQTNQLYKNTKMMLTSDKLPKKSIDDV